MAYSSGSYQHGSAPGPRSYVNEPTRVVYVNRKSVVLTYVLWFFLGSLGIHKFYLAQPIQGIFYLLLTGLTGLLAPVGLPWIPGGLLLLLLFKDAFTNILRVAILNAR
ncbi:MAG: TM2 domain-containing protein [Rothia sp. (in: high G+C Gram-positive bacteria)]|uniref:TM2 domain-containing protein n=1 Tax=Rothia sp. (in: high G+C Gram-positive bacteria) TaxID=1885016 RepID=UPI0026E00E52|nr:TM2 domain-containing protein [Rothia sp. (in: high G+C Gram-positive bacteria)]MDO5749584.1 TM2 domain-containing protein [Rothia sp. (in: high G+C Gram-positive bacteria)]